MSRPASGIPRCGIDDVFYETRVGMPEELSVARFAKEILGGSVEAVMLSYIEKGQRFPSEALVRRLAAVRGEDPRSLLALLARDRLLDAAGKQIKKVLSAPSAVRGVDDAELAVRVTQAIAALPDDGDWLPVQQWRNAFRAPPKRQKHKEPLTAELSLEVERILVEQGLMEVSDERVRRRGRHFAPQGTEQKQTLALEYCSLFLTGLLDSIAFETPDEKTYLRNHYFNIESERIPEFRQRLDTALRELAEEFASETSDSTDFFNVLTSAVRYEPKD